MIFIQENDFEYVACKVPTILHPAQCINESVHWPIHHPPAIQRIWISGMILWRTRVYEYKCWPSYTTTSVRIFANWKPEKYVRNIATVEYSSVTKSPWAIWTMLTFQYNGKSNPLIHIRNWKYVVLCFVKRIKNGCPCNVEIRDVKGCALVRDPAQGIFYFAKNAPHNHDNGIINL